MGAQCCGKDLKEQVMFQETLGDTQDSTPRNIRQGLPSSYLAIPMSRLYQQASIKGKWGEIQEWIYELKAHDKSKIRKIAINVVPTPENQLGQPYFLKMTNQFYIGQWVYFRKGRIRENVPGGIGRLYSGSWISEGVISTFINNQLSPQNVVQELLSRNSSDRVVDKNKNISNNNNRSNINEINSEGVIDVPVSTQILREILMIQDKETEQEKAKSLVNMAVQLQGQGRKFNKQQQFIGNFEKGQLHGRDGKWQVKDPKYTYLGQWEHGQRHGKGTEITDLTQYIGDFVKGQKTGRGTLIFKLSHSKQNDRLVDEKRIEKKMAGADQQKELMQTVKFDLNKRNDLQKLISKKLEQFKWQNKFTGSSYFDDLQFMKSNKLQTKFQQKYSGEFKNDQMHGKGVYTWFNGKTFSGDFVNGQIEGVGEFWWPDGVIYRGEYKNDRKHGKGEIIWSPKRRYRGSWAFGIRHGYGQYISIDEQEIITKDGKIKKYRQKQVDKDKDIPEKSKTIVMTIRGALWKQDIQQKVYFTQKIQIEEFVKIQKRKPKQIHFTDDNEQKDQLDPLNSEHDNPQVGKLSRTLKMAALKIQSFKTDAAD